MYFAIANMSALSVSSFSHLRNGASFRLGTKWVQPKCSTSFRNSTSLNWPSQTLRPSSKTSQKCASSLFSDSRGSWNFLSPQGLIFEMMFGAIVMAVGAAFSLAFGGALFAGAVSTAIFMGVVGTFFWVGMVLTVAVPIILCVGAGGAFLLYRASQTEDGKTLRENAKKQAQQFEQTFSAGKASSFTNFDGKGKVIDIEMDSIPDEETPEEREFRLKRRAVESELSDFDNRLRGR